MSGVGGSWFDHGSDALPRGATVKVKCQPRVLTLSNYFVRQIGHATWDDRVKSIASMECSLRGSGLDNASCSRVAALPLPPALEKKRCTRPAASCAHEARKDAHFRCWPLAEAPRKVSTTFVSRHSEAVCCGARICGHNRCPLQSQIVSLVCARENIKAETGTFLHGRVRSWRVAISMARRRGSGD